MSTKRVKIKGKMSVPTTISGKPATTTSNAKIKPPRSKGAHKHPPMNRGLSRPSQVLEAAAIRVGGEEIVLQTKRPAENIIENKSAEMKSVEAHPQNLVPSSGSSTDIPKSVAAVEGDSKSVEAAPLCAQEGVGLTEENLNILTPQRAKEIRKLRETYGKKLPPVYCNNCSLSQVCPQFKEGYECAFMGIVGNTKIETPDDLRNAMLRLAEAQMTTGELGLIQQRLSGGVIDSNTTNVVSSAFEMLAEVRKGDQAASQGNIPTQPVGNNIVFQLFGNLDKIPEATGKELLIEAKKVEPIPEVPEKEIAEKAKTDKETQMDEVLDGFDTI